MTNILLNNPEVLGLEGKSPLILKDNEETFNSMKKMMVILTKWQDTMLSNHNQTTPAKTSALGAKNQGIGHVNVL